MEAMTQTLDIIVAARESVVRAAAPRLAIDGCKHWTR